MNLSRLGTSFFCRPTLAIAESLLGRLLVHEGPGGPVGGRIVEVESYIGSGDPACHAAAGRTPRNEVMWGPPGFAYVYFTYGMHHCLNVVTEPDGFGAAVLIRALEPEVGLGLLASRQEHLAEHLRLSGPGRVCKGLGLDLSHNGLDLTRGSIWLGRGRSRPKQVVQTARVGIRKGRQMPWRYYLLGSRSVSGPKLQGDHRLART